MILEKEAITQGTFQVHWWKNIECAGYTQKCGGVCWKVSNPIVTVLIVGLVEAGSLFIYSKRSFIIVMRMLSHIEVGNKWLFTRE